MRVSIIAAVSENHVIGREGQLPWHLPDEFGWFRKTTEGHHVVMGRKTWESRSKPLPRRTNLVLSSNPDFLAPGASVVGSLKEAFDTAWNAGETELFVIGGTRLYLEALGIADRMYLTRVHTVIEDGDASFPAYDELLWYEVASVEHPADDRHAHAFTMRTFDRVR